MKYVKSNRIATPGFECRKKHHPCHKREEIFKPEELASKRPTLRIKKI